MRRARLATGKALVRVVGCDQPDWDAREVVIRRPPRAAGMFGEILHLACGVTLLARIESLVRSQ